MTYKNFPPCSWPRPHQPAHQHPRLAHCQQHLLSNAAATTQLLSSQDWVSPLLLGVGGGEESVKDEEDVMTQQASKSLGSNLVSLPGGTAQTRLPRASALTVGTDPGPTCQNHWICLLFLV